MSHEFRNPLASIRATAELAADATDSGERAAFVARIQRDIRRLEGLLEGVREMTLVDAQLEEDPRTAIDIVALVREAVGERGCGIQVRLPPQSVRVEASADRLRQVLGNLVDNAISFSPADAPPAVSVTATPSDVTVSIRDHGPGLANAHAARVFDRFFSHRPGQPDARTRHAGLGLSIAKAIVESYDGRIEIRNHDDGGAVASFTLPRC